MRGSCDVTDSAKTALLVGAFIRTRARRSMTFWLVRFSYLIARSENKKIRENASKVASLFQTVF